MVTGCTIGRLCGAGCIVALVARSSLVAALPAPTHDGGAAREFSTGGIALEWEAPLDCPPRDAVLDRVRALLGSRNRHHSALQARGTIVSTASGWSLSLRTNQGDTQWERTIEASTCEEVTEVGALILALAIDPNLGLSGEADEKASERGQASAEKAPDAQRTSPPKRTQDETSRPSPPAPARGVEPTTDGDPTWWSELQVHFRASAVLDAGALPRPALGVELSTGLSRRHFEMALVGTFLPEVREVVTQEPSRGGDFGLLGLGARACFVQGFAPLVARACLGLEGGRMYAGGFGATGWNREATDVAWWAGRAGVSARMPLVSPLQLYAALESVIPATRPEFVLEG
ncbi:MAG TPA: hypothetical protein VIM73_08405, partial [Polyangiaceae bacterium]